MGNVPVRAYAALHAPTYTHAFTKTFILIMCPQPKWLTLFHRLMYSKFDDFLKIIFKGSVSQKLRPRLLYIFQKLSL